MQVRAHELNETKASVSIIDDNTEYEHRVLVVVKKTVKKGRTTYTTSVCLVDGIGQTFREQEFNLQFPKDWEDWESDKSTKRGRP